LGEALKGQVAADIGDIEGEAEIPAGVPRHDLLEIYSPVRSSGTDTVIGAAEFYFGTAELRDEIADAQRRSWFVVGGTTLLIYLLLAAFVQRASNTIVGQQRALAGQVARLTELLRQNEELHARVRGAAARTTALNERFLRRFSAELHDGPAQEISLALLRLDHVAARCSNDGLDGEEKAAMAHDLDLIQASLSRALQDVRATSGGLLLPQLGALTLAQTVEHVVRGHRRRTGSTPTVDLRNLPDQAPLVAKIALYRILQESLQNASRHAPGADQRVTVAREDGHLRVEVRDTGSGFEVVTIGSSEDHLGLVGMRERVESLGGDFRIESAPGSGTRVVVALPLPPNGDNHA
jgi:signal transduction histidine kinase